MVPDELPQISVRLAGIGAAITPDAIIPLVGKVSDDYGLDRIWYEYQVDDGPVEERPLARQPDGDEEQTASIRSTPAADDAPTGKRAMSSNRARRCSCRSGPPTLTT